MIGLPHARGGVSSSDEPPNDNGASSPRPWGCFLIMDNAAFDFIVFPTPVGVFPALKQPAGQPGSLPHARGGVSQKYIRVDQVKASSPRPWGCFWRPWRQINRKLVFPTPVGVFPARPQDKPERPRLPHARGGVSAPKVGGGSFIVSSPRPWGCFLDYSRIKFLDRVFPTPVGVFLQAKILHLFDLGLPHARGGVSRPRAARAAHVRSSPRPWGCFSISYLVRRHAVVFPTPVGVFPAYPDPVHGTKRLPHARGGVSATEMTDRIAL